MRALPAKHLPKFDPASRQTNGILVLGDSHARSFRNHPAIPAIRDESGEKQLVFCHIIAGASMTGVGRRNSTLKLNAKIFQIIENYTNHCSHVMFAFGQVDVELGLYFKQITKDPPPDPTRLFESIITKYIDILQSAKLDKTILIKGINPTILEDHEADAQYVSRIIKGGRARDALDQGFYQKLLKIYPDFTTRSEYSRCFNDVLKEKAQAAGFAYFDIFDAVTLPNSNRVKPEYQPAGNDHHLVDTVAMRRLNWQALANAIKAQAGDDQDVG